jgi:uncharacterized membrane protein YkvA (DUF1232 family)
MNEIEKRQEGYGKDKNALKARDYIFLILALIYTISPVDLASDIPLIGYIDDFALDAAAIANFLQKLTAQKNETLSAFLKTLKKLALILGAIFTLLLLIFGALLFKIIKN